MAGNYSPYDSSESESDSESELDAYIDALYSQVINRFTPQNGGRSVVISNTQPARSLLPLRTEELLPQLPPNLHRVQLQIQQHRQQQQPSSGTEESLADEEEEEESIAEEPAQQNNQVRPSPPSENLRYNLSETLHVDGSEFLSVRQQRTFHINVTGRVYFVGVDDRLQVQDTNLAFMQVISDLVKHHVAANTTRRLCAVDFQV